MSFSSGLSAAQRRHLEEHETLPDGGRGGVYKREESMTERGRAGDKGGGGRMGEVSGLGRGEQADGAEIRPRMNG